MKTRKHKQGIKEKRASKRWRGEKGGNHGGMHVTSEKELPRKPEENAKIAVITALGGRSERRESTTTFLRRRGGMKVRDQQPGGCWETSMSG